MIKEFPSDELMVMIQTPANMNCFILIVEDATITDQYHHSSQKQMLTSLSWASGYITWWNYCDAGRISLVNNPNGFHNARPHSTSSARGHVWGTVYRGNPRSSVSDCSLTIQ